jgi:hypothetical protein
MMSTKRKESDWTLYQRICDECCEARRNHNIRVDLLQKDIAERFAKAVRASKIGSRSK